MRKVVATINLTLDGSYDHTAGIADAELHDHYTGLLNDAGVILYGRTTFQLMENFWPTLVKKPSGQKSMDDFALAMDNVPKIVFSRTLTKVEMKNSMLAKRDLKEEVLELRKQSGKDIFVGSASLIIALTKLNLIDEYQLCIHPVIAGGDMLLFKTISERIILKLVRSKTFGTGVILLCYQPAGY